MATPLVVLIWGRLRRLIIRFAVLAARVRAGKRPAPPRPSRSRPASLLPRPRLPEGFAWLVRSMQEAAGFGSQLQFLLADPEMAALLDAAPQAGRLLRPLCRMLGVEFPPPRAPDPPSEPIAAPCPEPKPNRAATPARAASRPPIRAHARKSFRARIGQTP